MKSQSLHNSKKKKIYRNVTTFHEVPLTSLFSSRCIMKSVETHPPPIRDIIIEQPLKEEMI